MNEQISLKEYPSKHYAKFFERFSSIDVLPVEQWDLTLIIAYFCKRYKTYYKLDYTFRFNNTAPTKSYEVYNFKKLAAMLSSNPIILKDYIDYIFETKIIARKKRITSVAILTDANTINDYKFKKLLMGKEISIDRVIVIPPIYMEILRKYECNFTNYGELSFAKRCVDAGDDKYKEMLNELNKAGMDISILNRIK